MKIKCIALAGLLVAITSSTNTFAQQANANEIKHVTEIAVAETQNLETAKTFFDALERHDLSVIEPFLASDVVEIIPFSNTGSPDPWRTFYGKKEVLGYLGEIVKNFSRTVLLDKQFTVSNDGNIVFLEAKGDLVHAASGAPYHNVYVFKFTFANGKITNILEYGNPVPYAKLAGVPLG